MPICLHGRFGVTIAELCSHTRGSMFPKAGHSTIFPLLNEVAYYWSGRLKSVRATHSPGVDSGVN